MKFDMGGMEEAAIACRSGASSYARLAHAQAKLDKSSADKSPIVAIAAEECDSSSGWSLHFSLATAQAVLARSAGFHAAIVLLAAAARESRRGWDVNNRRAIAHSVLARSYCTYSRTTLAKS